MPFIDWDGNGKIDPTDIAIGLALAEEDDEIECDETPPSNARNVHGSGCLTTVLIFMFGIIFTVLLVAMTI